MIEMPENIRKYIIRKYDPPRGYRSISVRGCIDGSLCAIYPLLEAKDICPSDPPSAPEEKEIIVVKAVCIGGSIVLVGYSRESNTVLFQV